MCMRVQCAYGTRSKKKRLNRIENDIDRSDMINIILSCLCLCTFISNTKRHRYPTINQLNNPNRILWTTHSLTFVCGWICNYKVFYFVDEDSFCFYCSINTLTLLFSSAYLCVAVVLYRSSSSSRSLFFFLFRCLFCFAFLFISLFLFSRTLLIRSCLLLLLLLLFCCECGALTVILFQQFFLFN